MDTVISGFKKLSDGADALARWTSIIYALVSTVVVLASVFLRMAGNAPSWSEELARWLLIGMTFISGSVALRRGQHIGVTALVKMIKNKTLVKIILQISNLLVFAFLAYAFYYSLDAALDASDQMGDIIPINFMWVKIQLPAGLAIMIIHLLYFSVAMFKSDNPHEFMLSQ
jgi:TRAP-type C4-dicarboxylate transport system permease small subunit